MKNFVTLTDGKAKVSMVRFRGRYLSPLLALTLAGCFRSSDEVAQDFESGGEALSGPLVNAIAFLDENGNRVLDDGEIFDRTNAEDNSDPSNVIEAGSFTLVATTDAQRAADIVVVSDSSTIDTSTGVSPGDITFVASQSSDGVVTPMTTMIVEGGISKEALAAAFGFDPSVVDLETFNPFASDLSDAQAAQAENVEGAAKQVVGMLRAIATMADSAGVGVSADGEDLALSIAIDAVASQLKSFSDANKVFDFSDAEGAELNEFLAGAISSAITAVSNVEGASELTDEFAADMVGSMSNVAAFVDGLVIDLNGVNGELSVLQALEANVVAGVAGGAMALAADDVDLSAIAESVAPSGLVLESVDGASFVQLSEGSVLQLASGSIDGLVAGDGVASASASAGGSDSLTYSVVGVSGRESAYVEVGASSGAITLTAAGVEALQADASDGFDFGIKVMDGLGKYIIESFSISVNEAPSISVSSGVLVEGDGDQFLEGQLTASDSDSEVLSYSAVSVGGVGLAGQYGDLVLNADGSYVYTIDGAKLVDLDAGDAVEDVYTVTVSDGVSSASAALTISITGTSTGAVLKGPMDGAIVFADYDGDGILDVNEPRAQTATDGSYGLHAGSGLTGGLADSTSFAAGDYSVVVNLDAATDSTSGESYKDAGVTLKGAGLDGGVVTPMTTLHEHSADHEESFSAAELSAALGLDPTVDILTFNSHAEGVDSELAHEVETIQQHLMATTMLVQSAVKGAGTPASGVAVSDEVAHDVALDGLVKLIIAVHKENTTGSEDVNISGSLDLSDHAHLEELEEFLEEDLEAHTEVSIPAAVLEYVLEHSSHVINLMNTELDRLDHGEFGGAGAGAVSHLKHDVAEQIGDMAIAARAHYDTWLADNPGGTFDRGEADTITGVLTGGDWAGFNPDAILTLNTQAAMDDQIARNLKESADHLGVDVFVNATSGKAYVSLDEAISDAAENDVLTLPAIEIAGDIILDKSLTLNGAFAATKAATWDDAGIPIDFDPSGRGEETVITGSIIVNNDVTGVSLNGLYINPADDGSPLQLGSGVDSLTVKNSFLTGYDAGKLSLSAISNLTLSDNVIGGVSTVNSNGGSLYLTDIEGGAVEGNLFWRPGAAHLYLENLVGVDVNGNNFYHGLHAGGANYDDLLGQAPSGTGSGYGYGYGEGYGSGYGEGYGSSGYGGGYGSSGYGGGYGSSGYGSGQGADGAMYGRNYWLEVKGVNSDLTIDSNIGNFNSGGIQVYGEEAGATFTNLTITNNKMDNFVNADPNGTLLDEGSRHLSGNMGGISISIDENLASATNVVITGNDITGAADQVLSNQDVNSLIQVAGDITGLDISNNTLNWSNSLDEELNSIEKNFSDNASEALIGVQIVGAVDGASPSPIELDGNAISFTHSEVDKFIGNGFYIGDEMVDDGESSSYGQFSGDVAFDYQNTVTGAIGVTVAEVVVTSDTVLDALNIEYTDPNSYLKVYRATEEDGVVEISAFTIEDDVVDETVEVYENVGFTIQLTGADNISVTEDGGVAAAASGTIAATAIVASDEDIVINAENENTSFGGVEYNSATNAWTYELKSNDTVDAFTPESNQSDTITFTVTRGDVEIVETATVAIVGVDDPLIVSFDKTSEAIDLSADQGTSATFAASVSDKDDPIDGGVWTFEDPTYGTLVENDGVFTYTADNTIAETRALASTDTQTETISLTFTNGDDVKSTDVAIAITGKDEPELFTVQSLVDTGSVAQVEIIINGDAIVDSIAGATSSSSIRGVDFSITPLSSGVVVDGVTVSFQAADRMDWYDADDLFTTWTDEQDKFRETSLYTGVVGAETIAIGDTQPFVNSTGTYSREMDGTSFDFSEFVGTEFVLGKLTFRDFPEGTPSDFDIEVSGTVVTMDGELSFTTSTVDLI
jgi:VCBS repeat-containing protein